MTDPSDPRDHHPKRVEEFDEYARQAGSSLRIPPPAEGAMAAMRTGRRRVAVRTALAVGAVGVLAIGALVIANRDNGKTPASADNSPDASPTTAAGPATTAAATSTVPATTAITAAPTTTTAAAPPTSAATDPATSWALEYVGGTAGVAIGEPVKIGHA